MPEIFDISVIGNKELQKKFDELPLKIARKLARKSMRRGAKILQTEVKKRSAPISKEITRRVKVRSMKKKKGKVGIVVVVDPKQELAYESFVEAGTKHVAPRPYLRGATDAVRTTVIKEIISGLKEAIREASR